MTLRSPAAPHRFGDYKTGEKIDHVDGITVEEAEHRSATRLYQNTARIHFDQFTESTGPLRQAADLRRPRHLAGARALRSTGSPMPSTSPPSMAAAMSRRCSPAHGVRVVGGAGQRRAAGPRRRRRAAAAHRRHQGPALRGFSGQERRRTTTPPSARSRLLGADPAVRVFEPAPARRSADHAAGDAIAGIAGRIGSCSRPLAWITSASHRCRTPSSACPSPA